MEFYKFVILIFCFIYIHELVDKIKLPSKKVDQNKKRDLYQHPLLVEAGIRPPVEEVELEEVEFIPLQWQVKYNERIDNFITIKIEENEQQETSAVKAIG
jgi:hypothetical protein